MMIHQDGSTHEWVAGQKWDLIVTMDDATNEHYSMAFVEEEGTESSFQSVREVIEACGLFKNHLPGRLILSKIKPFAYMTTILAALPSLLP